MLIYIWEANKMNYDKEFKEDAIRLSDEIGVKKAADQLGLHYSTLSTWRSRSKQYRDIAFVGSGNKRREPMSEKDRKIYEMEKHIRELERSNDILKEALGFFAFSRKK